MKKIFGFLLVFLFVFTLVSCKDDDTDQGGGEQNPPVVTKYTVQFYVEDEVYKTLRVEENTVVGAENVASPVLSGFEFVEWLDEDNKPVDLDSFKITEATKFYAKFKEVVTDDTLVVDAVKEDGKEYYFVVGWWETTALNEDGTPKITSSLDATTVRVFYANLKLYLKAAGATEEQLKNIQFRNYSTETVAPMGEKINADGDVDLVIGVGNNINSTAGVSLFEGNDGKTTALMGTEPKSRYVALPEHENMNTIAISVFDWIKTEVGQKAFTTQLSESQIVVVPPRTDEVNVKVNVHGYKTEEITSTELTNKNDAINVPTYEVPAGHKFLGYATTVDATVPEIAAALGVALTYAEIEELLNGAAEINLYPVIIEEVVNNEYDLVVYMHVTSTSKMSEIEAALVALRFEESLAEPKKINYVWVTEGKADDFLAKINDDIAAGETIDVVIGGNKTTTELTAIDDVHINVSCAAGHFADGSRKVIVLNSCATAHLELAKSFYSFMTTEAPVYKLHVAYWAKETWITADEMTNVSAGINGYLNTLFAVADALTTYKLEVVYYQTTKSSVADLSVETKAFNDGKGVGLIVGTGGNAVNEGNMGSAIVEQKDCPTNLVAANRKVALCTDNMIYRAIYENYFVAVEVAE